MGRRRHRLRVADGYRRLLVPLDGAESFEALDIACRLAADNHASITAIAVVEVPPLLPLDAHMEDAEVFARRLLEQAIATGDSYGVKVATVLRRARDVGAAIVGEAASCGAELVVVGATRSTLATSPHRAAPDVVLHVLRAAPCRVMVVSASARAAA
jgi:nucleotide-binding universal stress UspA family protein